MRRLHPGPGHATVAELWLRWGRLAVGRRARRYRPSLSLADRLLRPSQTSVLVARAHYGHGLRVPVEYWALQKVPEDFLAAGRRGRAGLDFGRKLFRAEVTLASSSACSSSRRADVILLPFSRIRASACSMPLPRAQVRARLGILGDRASIEHSWQLHISSYCHNFAPSLDSAQRSPPGRRPDGRCERAPDQDP